MKATPNRNGTTMLSAILAHMGQLERPIAEQLRDKYPNARVMTAWDDSQRGVIDKGESMLVEPCDGFDIDGLYVLSGTPALMVVRGLYLLCATAQVSIETTNGYPPEVASLADVRKKLDIVGRVVASCAIKLH